MAGSVAIQADSLVRCLKGSINTRGTSTAVGRYYASILILYSTSVRAAIVSVDVSVITLLSSKYKPISTSRRTVSGRYEICPRHAEHTASCDSAIRTVGDD